MERHMVIPELLEQRFDLGEYEPFDVRFETDGDGFIYIAHKSHDAPFVDDSSDFEHLPYAPSFTITVLIAPDEETITEYQERYSDFEYSPIEFFEIKEGPHYAAFKVEKW